jgi:hypothetical protein
MEQEDYLMRQINQIGRILGKILVDFIGLKNKGQVNIAIETTNTVLKDELDFDIQELIEIPSANFINKLMTEKQFNNDCFEKLAEILLLIADNTEEKNRKVLYEKCLTIFEYLEEYSKIYSLDRQWKIEQIKKYV